MQRHTEHNEQALLNDLRSGKEEAFSQIFTQHWPSLYRIARSKVRSHEEAEEIIQQVFSNLWAKRKTLLISNLSFYLQAAVRNRIINELRSRITHEKYWTYYKNFIPTQKDVTEEDVAFEDLNEALETAVNRLPEKSRQVFRLSRLEGRSTAEIANLLKLSEKAIEYHITKSLKEIRLQLKDFILIVLLFNSF